MQTECSKMLTVKYRCSSRFHRLTRVLRNSSEARSFTFHTRFNTRWREYELSTNQETFSGCQATNSRNLKQPVKIRRVVIVWKNQSLRCHEIYAGMRAQRVESKPCFVPRGWVNFALKPTLDLNNFSHTFQNKAHGLVV